MHYGHHNNFHAYIGYRITLRYICIHAFIFVTSVYCLTDLKTYIVFYLKTVVCLVIPVDMMGMLFQICCTLFSRGK